MQETEKWRSLKKAERTTWTRAPSHLLCQCTWMTPTITFLCAFVLIISWSVGLPEEFSIKYFLNIVQDCWQVLQSSNLMTHTHTTKNTVTCAASNLCRRWLCHNSNGFSSHVGGSVSFVTEMLPWFLTFCIWICLNVWPRVSSENKSNRILMVSMVAKIQKFS